MKIHICICSILLFIFTCHGTDFDLGTRGTLSITLPEDWKIKGEPAKDKDGTPIGYAFAIKPRSDANAKCLLTFAYIKNGAPNKEAIRKKVLRGTREILASSVEKEQNLKDFTLQSGYGAYCVFTDASLVGKPSKSDDYKVIGSGEVQPGDNMLGVVSIFADDANGKEFKDMIKIINSLNLKPANVK